MKRSVTVSDTESDSVVSVKIIYSETAANPQYISSDSDEEVPTKKVKIDSILSVKEKFKNVKPKSSVKFNLDLNTEHKSVENVEMANSNDSQSVKKLLKARKSQIIELSSDSTDNNSVSTDSADSVNKRHFVTNVAEVDRFFQTKLNSNQSKNNFNKWDVDDVDMLPIQKKGNRFYNSGKEFCEVCLKKGHDISECVRSGPVCTFCATEGHLAKECPEAVCLVCFQNGHITKKCANKNVYAKLKCARCGQRGHPEEICGDLWRQYKFTTRNGSGVKMVSVSSQFKSSVYCANCSHTSHFTDQCNIPRMSYNFVGPAPIVEIVRYDCNKNIYFDFTYKPSTAEMMQQSLNESATIYHEVPSFMGELDITLGGNVDNHSKIGDEYITFDSSTSVLPPTKIASVSGKVGDKLIMLDSPVAASFSAATNGKFEIDYEKVQVPDRSNAVKALPKLNQKLLRQIFPDETNDLKSIPPPLRRTLRKKLQTCLENGYVPADSKISQARMESWLQCVHPGARLSYHEEKNLLGSVSAAIFSISDRISGDIGVEGCGPATVARPVSGDTGKAGGVEGLAAGDITGAALKSLAEEDDFAIIVEGDKTTQSAVRKNQRKTLKSVKKDMKLLRSSSSKSIQQTQATEFSPKKKRKFLKPKQPEQQGEQNQQPKRNSMGNRKKRKSNVSNISKNC